MAQATAVQTKIAMIAAIRFNMLGCASTLSARPQPTSPVWCCQVLFIVKYKQVRGSSLLHTPIALPRAVIPSEARNLSSLLFAPLRPSRVNCQLAGLGHAEGHQVVLD